MRSAGLVAVVLVGLVTLAAPGGPRAAEACAFDPRVPWAYEAEQTRTAYLTAVDAASANLLFPGDGFFGTPAVESGTREARATGPHFVPPTLLKALAWVESTLTMASRSVPFQSPGVGLVSFDCGHGIMQVTTGMTVPLGIDGRPTDRQVLVATHYAYNVARGAAILADKWNQAPELRPIVGTDTGGDPSIVENWYYATWSYNGFTGPGSTRSNHPLDPSFDWPRTEYRCDGTQSRTRYPYQELVWGCMKHPPRRDGRALWQSLDATLPDLGRIEYYTAFAPARWVFPYREMDIPTPPPAHVDAASGVAAAAVARMRGDPAMQVDSGPIELRLDGLPSEATSEIVVRNAGTGLLSYSASSSAHWLVLDPPAGVALGSDVPCGTAGCERHATVSVGVNPTLLPAANAQGTVRIRAANGSDGDLFVSVEVFADFEVGVPGTSRAY